MILVLRHWATCNVSKGGPRWGGHQEWPWDWGGRRRGWPAWRGSAWSRRGWRGRGTGSPRWPTGEAPAVSPWSCPRWEMPGPAGGWPTAGSWPAWPGGGPAQCWCPGRCCAGRGPGWVTGSAGSWRGSGGREGRRLPGAGTCPGSRTPGWGSRGGDRGRCCCLDRSTRLVRRRRALPRTWSRARRARWSWLRRSCWGWGTWRIPAGRTEDRGQLGGWKPQGCPLS